LVYATRWQQLVKETTMSAAIKLKQLNHYNIRVPGELLETLRVFYTEVIGLKEGWAPGPASFPIRWLYLGDQPVLHLNGIADDASRAAATADQPTGWLDHVAFSCSDHQAAAAHLDKLGVAYALNAFPQFGIVQLMLRDPAGIQIELNFAGEC
jgi:catechol 2,3-dioxygenase-like lactoylglutathione lyase family enzyme